MEKTTNLKSRSFITTILIVVLLLVTLSTATYAWFSANNIVGISQLNFVATTNNAVPDLYMSWHKIDDPIAKHQEIASSGIYIDSDREMFSSDAKLKVYEFQNAVENPKIPLLMPNIAPYAGQDVNEFVSSFYTSSATTGYDEVNNQFVQMFRNNGVQKVPLRLGYNAYAYSLEHNNQVTTDHTASIYLNNINSELPLRMRIVFNVKDTSSNDIDNKLHVAVFANDKLVGILGRYPWIKYGDIVKDALVTEIDGIVDNQLQPVELGTPEPELEKFAEDGSYKQTSKFSFIVPSNGSVKVTLYCWYDGSLMENSNASTYSKEVKTQASFEFVGTYEEPGVTE